MELIKILNPNSSQNQNELIEKLINNKDFLANVCSDYENKELAIEEKTSIKKEIKKAYHFLAKKKIIREKELVSSGMHPTLFYEYKLKFDYNRTIKK
ncbi:hypothetical protein GF374_01525 [Candidatus Woesearchaeota archaeon]|nr:hypothetical protein [Candidatus Woesearchaeota archaeon]